MLSGKGWAISTGEIAEIAVFLDERFLCFAAHGLPRPDLAHAFPNYDGADHAGFVFAHPVGAALREAALADGPCALTLRLRLTNGAETLRVIPAATTIGAPAEPPQSVASPQMPMQMAVDESRIDAKGLLRLQGWVVAMAPVMEVAVFLGDTRLNPPQMHLRRADIEASYAAYPNAEAAGFLLVQDITALADQPAVLRVVAHAADGRRRQIVMPLTRAALSTQHLTCDPAVQLCCDEALLTHDGALLVGGWALAESSINQITVALDGVALGLAETGQPRPDIGNRFPRNAQAPRAGFRFNHQMPTRLQGAHALHLRLCDATGRESHLDIPLEAEPDSARLATVGGVLATPAPVIRLELDTPAIAGDRAVQRLGDRLIVSGWAIAQGGIARVEIWLDEEKRGDAFLGQRRDHVAAAFPDIEGAQLAGFIMPLPQRAFAEGWHSMRVVACAKSGRQVERAFQIEAAPEAAPEQGQLRLFVPQAETDARLAILSAIGDPPSFTILVCARSGNARQARDVLATVQSLQRQTFTDWCALVWLTDPHLPISALETMLADDADLATRVLLHRSALPPAWPPTQIGRHILLCCCEAGDKWSADALLELALEAARGAGADFVYADERRHDIATNQIAPWYKPDWAPELLMTSDYIGRAWCASATLLRVAGLTPEVVFEQGNHHAVLRLTALAREIRHVPALLHGRAENGCAGAAVQPGRVEVPGTPLVSVIIPTCAARAQSGQPYIERVVDTLRRRTEYPAVEVIVIDNIPTDQPEWKAWLRDEADHVIDQPGAFNWSVFNNAAAAAARGAYLLFLNDDIETDDAGWLRTMLDIAQRPEIGVVGPLLLYPNGTVQHAGMFLSTTHAVHAYRFLPGNDPGPFGLLQTQRDVTAVTGACMLMRRAVFAHLGGFEAAHSIINNDLDFCLRAGQAGYRIVYTPHARLTHHELASRAALPDTFDTAHFYSAWRQRFLLGDPLFNPNLAGSAEACLPEPEPVETLYTGHPLIAASDVRRILVAKLDHIDDFVIALPALRRLRSHFPHATISLLASPETAILAGRQTCIDDAIPFHCSSPLDEVALQALHATLTQRRFDIAVDFCLQPNTRRILRYSGARLLAGFAAEGQFHWLGVSITCEPDMRLRPKRAHASDKLLLLADALGNACLRERRSLQAPHWPADRTRLAEVLASCGATPAFARRKLVCLHPGADKAIKRWPAASYAGLIDLLQVGHGVGTMLIGSADDAEVVAAVLSEVSEPQHVTSLVGRVADADLANIISACVLYISNDYGPKNLAASLGVPTITVHSGNTDATECGPLGPRAVAIRRHVACSPCYLVRDSDCPRSLDCLTGIRVQDVYRLARLMLEYASGF
jgi:ADP-heptose:LPS heptosyltransferase/GT2 family glycosyltransferase